VNGTWEISSVSVEKGGQAQSFRLMIKRPSGASRTTYISRHYNANTMSPVDDDTPLSRDEKPFEATRAPMSAPPTARFRKRG
ncbi:MAG TPA: hypothetical protein VEF76_14490, partial [Patescibacteria group bacterium]|nr:hypothetical protein [Patescibacteria group bacterium]